VQRVFRERRESLVIKVRVVAGAFLEFREVPESAAPWVVRECVDTRVIRAAPGVPGILAQPAFADLTVWRVSPV